VSACSQPEPRFTRNPAVDWAYRHGRKAETARLKRAISASC